MSKIHIANTFFESELKGNSSKSLTGWLLSHPIVLQLQFLPLLYAKKDDLILVTELPENPDPRLITPDQAPKNSKIEDWGASLAIQKWAIAHQASYQMPKWDIVKEVNSKLFSFTHAPKLKDAKVLESTEAIEDWLNKTPNPKVLKSPYETAGRGHIINPQNRKKLKPPLIGEPWLERTLDFSTQWKNKDLLGVIIFETNKQGTYERTYVGDVPKWALDEHLEVARPIIEKIINMGYFGHIGVDAFIYKENGKEKLHPIVEINARKTMSWVALNIPSKYLYFGKRTTGSLPSRIRDIQFNRNISIHPG